MQKSSLRSRPSTVSRFRSPEEKFCRSTVTSAQIDCLIDGLSVETRVPRHRHLNTAQKTRQEIGRIRKQNSWYLRLTFGETLTAIRCFQESRTMETLYGKSRTRKQSLRKRRSAGITSCAGAVVSRCFWSVAQSPLSHFGCLTMLLMGSE